ncbi:MAG: O-antigen ligase family protein [Anaerolineae bacterium]|nr:O-antigen ligase family protein [Anaerolineae bacterium]
MTEVVLQRFTTYLFHPDRRVAIMALLGLCLLGALVGGLYVGILGALYALAGAAALIAALLMLRSTQWGLIFLVGIICLLPFAALPMFKSRLGFTPTFLDLVVLLIFFVWVTRLATRRERTFVGSPLGLPVALFLVFALFAFALGMGHARPTSTILRRFLELLIGIALFFVVVNTVRRRQELERLAGVIMLAGAGAAFIAVFLYVIPQDWAVRLLSALGRLDYPTGSGVLRFIEDNPDLPMRAIGTSIDPNVLGGLMVFVAGLTVPQLFAERPLFDRRLVALMLGAEVLCLYLTYSRSSMAGFALVLLLLALLRYRRLLWVGLLGAALLLLLPQTQTYIAHFIEGLRGQDLATRMRFGEYKDAFILIGRHPWLGVGFSGTPEIDVYLGVSNVYLLIAEEMGLIGLSLFLLTVALLFVRFYRCWRRGVGEVRLEAILLGLSGALAGVLAAGVLDHYLFNLNYPHMAALFWLYVGLAAVGMGMAEGARDTPAPPA